MTEFMQVVVTGLSDGGIFASVALALVLVNRVSGTINFAQGEMAMFSTFIAWTVMTSLHWPYVVAVLVAIAASFGLGILVQTTLVRSIAERSHLDLLLLTIGLFYLFNGGAGVIWGYSTHGFTSPVPNRSLKLNGVLLNERQLAVIGITVLVAGLCFCFFRYTNFGLAMRAASAQPVESRLLGVSVGRVQAVGWGLAAAVGAVAGILVAPVQFLEPNMMQPVLLFAFSAVVLGGIDSMLGAIVGGLLIGLLLDIGTYIAPSLNTLNTVAALAVIVLVLYVKPNGLFGRAAVRRA